MTHLVLRFVYEWICLQFIVVKLLAFSIKASLCSSYIYANVGPDGSRDAIALGELCDAIMTCCLGRGRWLILFVLYKLTPSFFLG
jgi:hypothetical protein